MLANMMPATSVKAKGKRQEAKGKKQKAKIRMMASAALIFTFAFCLLPLAFCFLPSLPFGPLAFPPSGRLNYLLDLEVRSRTAIVKSEAARLAFKRRT
jgi:hypothetical protein